MRGKYPCGVFCKGKEGFSFTGFGPPPPLQAKGTPPRASHNSQPPLKANALELSEGGQTSIKDLSWGVRGAFMNWVAQL